MEPKPFTVIYAHNLPLGQGVAAFHHSLEMAESPTEAGMLCKGYLGGYCTVISVIAGHHAPEIVGLRTHVWANKERYDTYEITDIPKLKFVKKEKYICLQCNNPTAEKQPDIQGWDGYCSKCGMIAQSQVGDPAGTAIE